MTAGTSRRQALVARRLSFSILSLSLLASLACSTKVTTGLNADHASKPRARLAFIGDVMLGRGVQAALAAGGWENGLEILVPHLKNADLALGNLESPLTAASYWRRPENLADERIYDLRAPPSGILALKGSGLDLIMLANNHIMDGGIAGLEDTKVILNSVGMTTVGPGPQPARVIVNNLLFTFLALDDVSAPVDLELVSSLIQEERAEGAFVVVSVHWGGEYIPGPNPRQRFLAQELANAGAALVWGHHPHVLQPIVWSQEDGQPTKTLVAFSLGNALFDQVSPPDARRGAVLLVDFTQDGILQLDAIPFCIDPILGNIIPADYSSTIRIWGRLGIREQP